MWKNILEPSSPPMTIRCMRIACCGCTKAPHCYVMPTLPVFFYSSKGRYEYNHDCEQNIMNSSVRTTRVFPHLMLMKISCNFPHIEIFCGKNTKDSDKIFCYKKCKNDSATLHFYLTSLSFVMDDILDTFELWHADNWSFVIELIIYSFIFITGHTHWTDPKFHHAVILYGSSKERI